MVNVTRMFVFAVLAASLLASTACSWTSKKKVVPVKPSTAQATPAPKTAEPPASAKAEEAPRAEGLRPFPEMQVIYFDFDKSDIRKDQLPRIDANLQWLKGHGEAKVYIEGNCDERGTNEYNMALGERRAKAVAKYYLDGGIAADRIQTISKGEEAPAVLGKDEAAWSKNRRAEFQRWD